jgi:Flp pilus assembly protein TadD
LPELRLAYVRKLLESNRMADALAQLKTLTAEKPDYADAWLMQGSIEYQTKQIPAAKTSLQKFLSLTETPNGATNEEQGRSQVQAYLVLSQVAEQEKDLALAEAYLLKVTNPQDILRVQSRRALLLARQGKLEQARALIRSQPELQPEDARAKVTAEVQLLREVKQNAAVYELLNDAVKRFPDDIDLVYDQAMAADKLGKFAEMEQLLRQVMAAKPDYHHAYNALGYSLADRNVRLNEARALIVKALEMAPNDPYIVDSLAWVEFRSGNLAEAARLLKQAFNDKPDAEIAAHLGEVLWLQGQRDEAIAIWNTGNTLNADNETLQETIKRLRGKP